jgi:hypothetical protein
MLSAQPLTNRPDIRVIVCAIAATVAAFLLVSFPLLHRVSDFPPLAALTDQEDMLNAEILTKKRELVLRECREKKESATERAWRTQLEQANMDAKDRASQDIAKSSGSEIRNDTNKTEEEHQRCRFSFFDFGANVGDSLGKFISVGIPSCENAATTTASPAESLSSSSSFAGHTSRTNRLIRWTRPILTDLGRRLEGRTLEPEHYCYFGVEGNPVFTSRLQALQDSLMRLHPRPIRYAQFYTESVGADSDGPTVLYLDTKNADKNYWGSSTLYSHRDVQASASEHGGQVYQATVQGVTLTTLLRRHVVSDHGSHVIVKLDIEGSEYAVLNEAAESGILCDFVSRAVQVDILCEIHSKDVVGTLDAMERFRREVKPTLEGLCGVNLHLTMEAD